MSIINPLSNKNLYGFSNLDYLSAQNKQNQSLVSGLLMGIPMVKTDIFSSVSPNFMYQVYDAKAMSPQIINNYLNKVDETLASETDAFTPERQKVDYKTIVDEIIETNENKEISATSEIENGESELDDFLPLEDQTAEVSVTDHFGIVGEIFDKYA